MSSKKCYNIKDKKTQFRTQAENPEVLKIEAISNNKRVGIMTLGCKVNQYESQAIAEEFERNGFTVGRFSEKCDVYVINTCTVTAESDRKARQMIRRAARHNPNAYVLVTGCYSQLNPFKASDIDGVDFVCGNSNKLRLVDAAIGLVASGEKNGKADIKVDNIMKAPLERMCITASERTRAYVKIEDGCDNRCAYCTVPLARGHVRSKAPAEVIAEVRGLVSNGYVEIVLTGIETASYGRDFDDGYTLADLLEEVDKIDGIRRIRLGSLDPALMKPEFVERLSRLEHLCPHFHLAIQSGSSKTLAAMRRRHSAEMSEKYIANLREKIPGVTFSADIIVGFPGETEEDFLECVEFARRVGFIHLHVFPYSKRAGTEAAEMENQVPEDVKSDRLARLEKAAAEVNFEQAKGYIGAMREVLFETSEDGISVGHTEDFLEVSVITQDELHGKLLTVKLNGFDGTRYSGFIV